MSTDYQQGSSRLAGQYGSPPLAVNTDGRYTALSLDTEGRLLASQHEPNLQTTSDTHAPAASTAAVITYAAPGLGLAHVIDGVVFSLNGTPAVGTLTVADGASTVFTVLYPAAAVIQPIVFPGGLRATANTALVITLTDPGDNATGAVNAIGHRVMVVDASARLGLLDFRQPSQSQYLPFL